MATDLAKVVIRLRVWASDWEVFDRERSPVWWIRDARESVREQKREVWEGERGEESRRCSRVRREMRIEAAWRIEEGGGGGGGERRWEGGMKDEEEEEEEEVEDARVSWRLV